MLQEPLTRREFAARSSAALLASLLPIVGCVDAGIQGLEPGVRPAAGEVLSEHTEALPGGATRVTTVIRLDSLPPNGEKSTQTIVRTTTPTSTGEIIDYDIAFTPPVVYASRAGSAARIRGQYVFIFGPVTGDVREDTVVIGGMLDSTPMPTVTRRVARSLTPNPEWAALTTEERLARALDLVNRYGTRPPPTIPGVIRVLDG